MLGNSTAAGDYLTDVAAGLGIDDDACDPIVFGAGKIIEANHEFTTRRSWAWACSWRRPDTERHRWFGVAH
jgi:hypothetical protein